MAVPSLERVRGVREALLEAAYDAAVTTGWSRVRMADVAAAAGVSRQTLYDHFGGREGLAHALAVREVQRFLDGTEAALAGHHDVVAAVDAAVRFALATARGNPLVHAVLVEDGEAGLLPYLTTRGEPVLVAARDRVAAYLRAHWPVVDAAAASLVAEVATRLTLSYLVLPGESVDACAARVATVTARLLQTDTRRWP